MSSKISSLVQKPNLDKSDSLVIVDSVALDNKKVSVDSFDARSIIPNQVTDLTRCIAPFPLLCNGQSPSSAITLAERNVILSPIFIPTTVTITHWGIRASSTGSPSFDVQYGIYSHEGGLPTTLLGGESFTIPILTGSEFNEQVLTAPIVLKRGVYWQAVLNKTAVTASLSSASPNNNLFGNLVGSSSDVTGSDPRCFSTVVPSVDNQLPASLVSRQVDMRVTTASQTTLRLRVSTILNYFRYTV